MRWTEFLAALATSEEITLVGPLLGHKHRPTWPTIYVDGGAHFRQTSDTQIPTVSVGDGDSALGTLDEVLPVAKDYSDLAFVLQSLPATIRRVQMQGFLGGRRDHELANFGEIHRFLKTRARGTVVDLSGPSGDRVIAFAQQPLDVVIHGLFSFFVLETCLVEIQGQVRYPLTPAASLAPLSSHGLSNEANGGLKITASAPGFLFFNETP